MIEPTWILAALTITGGSVGYVRKKSLPSLISGLVIGSTFVYAGYLIDKKLAAGYMLALGASAILLGTGISRGVSSSFTKPLPLIMSVLGASGSYYYGAQIRSAYT